MVQMYQFFGFGLYWKLNLGVLYHWVAFLALFIVHFENESCKAAWAGLLLCNPPASVSRLAGIIGMLHHTQFASCLTIHLQNLQLVPRLRQLWIEVLCIFTQRFLWKCKFHSTRVNIYKSECCFILYRYTSPIVWAFQPLFGFPGNKNVRNKCFFHFTYQLLNNDLGLYLPWRCKQIINTINDVNTKVFSGKCTISATYFATHKKVNWSLV